MCLDASIQRGAAGPGRRASGFLGSPQALLSTCRGGAAGSGLVAAPSSASQPELFIVVGVGLQVRRKAPRQHHVLAVGQTARSLHEHVAQLTVGLAAEGDDCVVWQLAARIGSWVSSGGHRSPRQTGHRATARPLTPPPCGPPA
jgi:hypothetical protein